MHSTAATAPARLTTALIYTRVSTDEQAERGKSLEAQLADSRRYAAREEGWVLGSEYQDILQGTRDDRPDYQRLLADVRALRAQGRPVAVVVAALDRFGRRLLERVRSREEFKGLGVPVHSVREGEVNDMVAGFLALMAEDEVRRLGERVRAVYAHVSGNGWRMPGRTPLGYRWRAATEKERRHGAPRSVLEADSLTAPTAAELFRRVAEGASIRAAARWFASLPAEQRGARAGSVAAVRGMLGAPVYCARPDRGDPDVPARPVGRWPALVDDQTWAAVQRSIASHAKVPHQASGDYLLTGLGRCPACGARVSGFAGLTGPRRYPTRRYRCIGGALGRNAPDARCSFQAPAAPIDATVLRQVEPLVSVAADDAAVRVSMRRAWQALTEPERGQEARRVKALEQSAAKARERLKRAAVLLVDGVLDRDAYDAMRADVERDLQAAEAELASLRGTRAAPSLPPLEKVIEMVGGWSAALHGSNVPAQREVLAALVERVEPVRVGRGRYQVRITWTPLGQALRAVSGDR